MKNILLAVILIAFSFNSSSDEWWSGTFLDTTKKKEDKNKKWKINKAVDQMTDASEVTIWTHAEIGTGNPNKLPAQLVLVCNNGVRSVYIDWRGVIGKDNIDVTTRFNKKKVKTSSWGVHNSMESSYTHNPKVLLNELQSSKSFKAKITPWASNPETVTFDLTGLNDALKAIEECEI